MKLMLVGYGGRGKSTLLRALMRQRKQEKSMPTVGVVVKNWRCVTTVCYLISTCISYIMYEIFEILTPRCGSYTFTICL